MADIWTRKSTAELLDEAAQGDESDGEVRPLKRTLSALNLVALGVGGIIGAGIFVLTGHAAAANAGPAVALSFLLGAVACAFAGLCYAEMSSTVPISGSAYTYAYATLGELIAWIIGWDLILEYAVGATTVAIGWSGYVVSLPGIWASISRRDSSPRPLATMRPSTPGRRPARSSTCRRWSIIIVITALLVVGIRETARFNNFIVAVKLVVIALFIVCTAARLQYGELGHGQQSAGRLHPAQRGRRDIWLVGAGARRGRGVLRLYRLRCRLDGGAGGQESDAGHADRDSRLAGHLHGAVCRGQPGAHRHRAVRQTERARSDRGRDRCRRASAGCRRSSSSGSSSA